MRLLVFSISFLAYTKDNIGIRDTCTLYQKFKIPLFLIQFHLFRKPE